MQLVVYSAVPKTTDFESSSSISAKIEILERSISTLKENIAKAQDMICNFQSCMVEQHPDLIAESRMLEAQILDLVYDSLNAKSAAFSGETAETDELDEFADTVSEPIDSRELKKSCKKLYRKIAMLTHPDRTKNKRLREMFRSAKKAYDALDLAQLVSMYDNLMSNFTEAQSETTEATLLTNLMSRFANLSTQDAELKKRWNKLQASDDYTLAHLYECYPETTSRNFKLYMLQQITLLRMRYEFMKSTAV